MAFNWINQPDAATSQVYYLSFKYSSTCFGQENDSVESMKMHALAKPKFVYGLSNDAVIA
jgi:hypothetical protein